MVVVGLFALWLCAVGVRAIGLVTRHSGAAGDLATQNIGPTPSAGRGSDSTRPHPGHRWHDGLPAEHAAGGDDLQQHDRTVADHVVSSEPGLPVDRLAELQALGEAVGFAATTVYAGGDLDSHPAQVVTEGRLDEVLDLDAGDAPLSGLARGEVVPR